VKFINVRRKKIIIGMKELEYK